MSDIVGGVYVCLAAWMPPASLWFLNDFSVKKRNYSILIEIVWYCFSACLYFLFVNLVWARLQSVFGAGRLADGPYLIGVLLGTFSFTVLLGHLSSTFLFRIGANLGLKIKVERLKDVRD
jgi:hypothetical protein